jgi:tetratricopeptide (TPR) repeat protein
MLRATLLALGTVLAFATARAQDVSPGPGRMGLDRLVEQAESHYQTQNWSLALESWKAVLERDPDHALAWLRCGNIHHRRAQHLSAAQSYRRVLQVTARGSVRTHASSVAQADLDTLRGKALVNLAMVNVELAREALRQVREVPTRDEVVRSTALALERDTLGLAEEIRAESLRDRGSPGLPGAMR